MKNMLILTLLNDYPLLNIIFYIKSLKLEIIEINDNKKEIYKPNLLIASSGQIQFRELLTNIYGVNYNPYCFISNDDENNLSIRAIYSWYLFNGCKKLAAFLNGKLIAMRVLTIYSGKKNKNKNLIFNPLMKTWLHCNNEKERHYGILLNFFNKNIEYISQV